MIPDVINNLTQVKHGKCVIYAVHPFKDIPLFEASAIAFLSTTHPAFPTKAFCLIQYDRVEDQHFAGVNDNVKAS